MSDIKKIEKKYGLDESHGTWDAHIDNWYSVEVFRLQTGKLPIEGDNEKQVFMDFLDNKELHFKLLKDRGINFGSIYLSAKRALYHILHKEQP